MNFRQRVGLAVWVHNLKMTRHLRRYGNVYYVSRKMRYAIVYVDADRCEEIILKLKRFNFVKKVERSRRPELKTEYSNPQPDKAKEYDYKMGL